jgi:DNA-binding transcriptional regulator of glucitol operon
VRRVLLAPKWLVGHVLVLVVAVAFCRLGWWQWGRYRQTQGGLQYLSYAVQWPVFAAFGVAMWARIVRDSLRPPAAAPQPPHRAGPRLRPAAGPTVANPALPGAAQPEPDDELAAYNRYLASLYERDRQEQR